MSDIDTLFDRLSDRQRQEFALWCAERVRHLMSDPRSTAALDVAARHLRGEATDEELDAARAAAWDAAWDATAAAARDAAARYAEWAAAAAAEDAARAAARDAERAAQRAELERMLGGGTTMSEIEMGVQLSRLRADLVQRTAERDALAAEVAALKDERQAANEALRDAHLLIMLLRTHVVEIVDHGDFMVAMGYEPSGHATLHERHIRAFNAARVSVAGEEVRP